MRERALVFGFVAAWFLAVLIPVYVVRAGAKPRTWLVTVYACGEPVQRLTVERWERVEGGVYLPETETTILGATVTVAPWR